MKYLKSCDWLNAYLNQCVVLDCGILKPGEQGQYSAQLIVSGAKRFDISGAFSDPESSLPNTMCSAQQFQAQVRQLGINNSDTVVVYDDKGLFSAPRAWWMFKAMGYKKVYVLDGGLPAWQKANYPVTDSYALTQQIGNFIAEPQPNFFIDKQTVLKTLSEPDTLLLDARAKKRFSGEDPEPRANMRSGHIPNSKSLHYNRLLTNAGTLRSKEELTTLFNELDVKGKHLQFSCGSGVTACILALGAMEVGFEQSTLCVYDGSWSEWGPPSDLPIEVG